MNTLIDMGLVKLVQQLNELVGKLNKIADDELSKRGIYEDSELPAS